MKESGDCLACVLHQTEGKLLFFHTDSSILIKADSYKLALRKYALYDMDCQTKYGNTYTYKECLRSAKDNITCVEDTI